MAGKRINAEGRWRYNALDCAATRGLFGALHPMLNEQTECVYRAEMALEACTLAIQSKGIRIDLKARERLLRALDEEFDEKRRELEKAVGESVNPNSSPQVQALFYGKLGLKETTNKDGKVSVNEDVLTRITKGRIDPAKPLPRGQKQSHLEHCAELAKLVLEARNVATERGKVKSPLDGGRFRTSINVGATESFRFSASKTHFGRGNNLQAIKHNLREMFIPDPGMEMIYGDQDRAESTVVANISGDQAYISAHRAHDTHVEVAKLIWPNAGWTGEDTVDLALAEEPNFIRFYSRRDMSKRGQHLLNYYPPPEKWTIKQGPQHTLARTLGIPVKDAYEIANIYFERFPGIRDWQRSVIEQVRRYQRIYYPGDFYRDFFDRPWDPATHREAISSIPQAVVAWTNHIVMFRLWEQLETPGRFEVLMHNHDAVVLQCDRWEWWKPWVERLTVVNWPDGRDGEFSVPWSWKAGPNWKAVS